MRLALLAATLTFCTAAQAQFTLQNSNSTASFRGVHALNNGVAWVSGTEGTVLRTTDDGKTWQRCATPPNADKLDFRGIQAFDQNTAIVMSSGKGDLSRLYKTINGCKTWKLVFKNPDKDGFWDAVRANDIDTYEIAGDSVDQVLVNEMKSHIVPIWRVHGGDDPLGQLSDHFFELHAEQTEGGFAASNSTLVIGDTPHHDPIWSYRWLATQTPDHSFIHLEAIEDTLSCEPCRRESLRVETPMSNGTASAGIFSLAFRDDLFGVAVGGDYKHPDESAKTAIDSNDSGRTWTLAINSPHGYRSSVAYEPTTKTWITVGPNGTDISRDDGRNWTALKPSAQDAPDDDKNWNALSLPFVVGPKGRIGKLRPDALEH